MHGFLKTVCVAAAGLFAFASTAARAMVLTTWQMPENADSIDEENATEVAVLSIRRSLDETGTVVIYRTDAPGTLAACAEADEISPDDNNGGLSASFVENAAAKISLVRSFGGGGHAASRGGARGGSDDDGDFETSDIANSHTDAGKDSGGAEEVLGSGLDGWIQTVGPSMATRSVQGGDSAVSGDASIARAFADGAQLDSGTFEVEATHEFVDKFSGFAVYSGNPTDGYKELLRWGVAIDQDTGRAKFCTATFTGGQNNYTFFGDTLTGEGTGAPISVAYALTWTAIESGLQFEVSATTGGSIFNSGLLQVADAGAVSSISALTEAGRGDGVLRLNSRSIAGLAIPEPGTVSLLLFGVAVLGAKRRKNAAQ